MVRSAPWPVRWQPAQLGAARVPVISPLPRTNGLCRRVRRFIAGRHALGLRRRSGQDCGRSRSPWIVIPARAVLSS